MKIALSQIHVQFGDLDRITERIISRAVLAHEQGADVICVPAPLFTGRFPGQLLSNSQFESDLLHGLERISSKLEELDLVGLIPAAIGYGPTSLFEVFMLKDGRVIPLRILSGKEREGGSRDLWIAPVIEIADMRIAVTFDAVRDLPSLPSGCDMAVYFPLDAFSYKDMQYAGVLGLQDSSLPDLARSSGVWFAQMQPLGSFDSAVYIGGSFILDDCGDLVCSAPVFEESLLVCEVTRGGTHAEPQIDPARSFTRWDALWGSLKLYLQDEFSARGNKTAFVLLDGSFESSLLAQLVVDALGSRKVLAALACSEVAYTPQEQAARDARRDMSRALAHELGIQTIDLDESTPVGILGAYRKTAAQALSMRAFCALGQDLEATPVLPLTKTHLSLVAQMACAAPSDALLPFGDVYLSALEYLANERSFTSVPFEAPRALNAIEDSYARIVECIRLGAREDQDALANARNLLRVAGVLKVDEILEAHIDRDQTLENIVERGLPRDAAALALLLVRRGERYRRCLPCLPVVSERSFFERLWPAQLAWTDMGETAEGSLSIDEVVDRELKRSQGPDTDTAERMRSEIMGLIGGMLGIDPDQLEELAKGEGQGRIKMSAEDFERHMSEGSAGVSMRDVMMMQGGFPFFSKN